MGSPRYPLVRTVLVDIDAISAREDASIMAEIASMTRRERTLAIIRRNGPPAPVKGIYEMLIEPCQCERCGLEDVIGHTRLDTLCHRCFPWVHSNLEAPTLRLWLRTPRPS